MAWRNIVAGAALIALGLCYGALAAGLPERSMPYTPGPSFLPWIITGAVLALSLSLVVQGVRGARKGTRGSVLSTHGLLRPVTALVWFAVYLAVLPYAGFLWASVPFFAGLMALYGSRHWAYVGLASLATPVALFYLFRHIFQIFLPQGVL